MAKALGNRKFQVAVICLLGAVAIYNVAHFHGRKPARRSLVLDVAAIEAAPDRAVTPNWAGAYEVPASYARNPFTGKGPQAAAVRAAAAERPGGVPRPAPAKLNITGVVISGDKRYVLVGDSLLREGDRLGRGRIITINGDRVIVEYETGTETIYME